MTRQPNLLLQKFPARSFAVETVVESSPLQAGEEAGLVVAGERQLMIGLRFDGTSYQIVQRVGDVIEILAGTQGSRARFGVRVEDGGVCVFAYAVGDDLIDHPRRDQTTKGTWIGAKVGLYSIKEAGRTKAGHADVDYFRYV